MRLHSNFTSIDRRLTSSKNQIGIDSVVDTSIHLQIDDHEVSEVPQQIKELKLEPRIKRQAQSIINRRYSDRIHMHPESSRERVGVLEKPKFVGPP